jgi:lipoprotein-anchoring transpeptidase ErfK/SrfK
VRRTGLLAALSAVLVLCGCAAQTSGSLGRPLALARPSGPNGRPAAAARAPAPPDRCAGSTAAQLVLVDLSAQHLWMCARGHTVRDTPVTTGRDDGGNRTPTGHYRVQGRDTHTTLVPDTGEAYPVRYWIPFDAPDYGFHDSSWQHFAYGSTRYRTAGSHGCVHMPLAAIAFLYRWVHLGAAVTIQA